MASSNNMTMLNGKGNYINHYPIIVVDTILHYMEPHMVVIVTILWHSKNENDGVV